MEGNELTDLLGEDLVNRIDAVEQKAADLTEAISSEENSDEITRLRGELEGLSTEMATLQGEREERLREAERKAMQSKITSLEGAIEELRKPGATDGFRFAGGVPAQEDTHSVKAAEYYSPDSEFSYYNDLAARARGDAKATRRLAEVEEELEGKAMTEGTGSAGGFLVPDQISSELLSLRVQNEVVRPLFSSINVTSDLLRISSVTGGLTAGWVAELATKPQQDMTFGEITASVFTAAGLATASNQLLRDSVHSVDQLVNADLAKRLATVVELALIDGSGTGQPLGILGTSGVNTVTLTPTDIPSLLDAVTDAITAIYTNFLGAPSAIVMHPRTWARIVKARESASPTTYIVGPPGGIGRRPTDNLPGYNGGQTPRGELFGLPVYTTANVPTNKGAGTNESRIIVGAFGEGLMLDREAIQFDRSEHVLFTSNQTVFRAEEALGFTAARYPKAFSVVQGAGLANG